MTGTGFPEEELVEKARSGGSGAFGRLVEHTLAGTWACAWRFTGNQADAEDLVQETYMKAWVGISKFRKQSGFATWLYRIDLIIVIPAEAGIQSV
ncbi:MAG: RNA polymerase sigma-70 factor ECF subfamily [Elusimicrobia bacterium]|nr:MAG: RNA polymerase sigma-70 factor ECF subfamily [Elusimicrobiota bacterium]KAF0158121.1 MAG: RNA polymerase sigma-70 factor ECF subfamily [Elusimicrobiota bacterium]